MPDFISYNKAIEANNLATVANKNCRPYKANTDFEMGDLTIYDDKIYQALSSFKSAISFDNTKWKLIADVSNGATINDDLTSSNTETYSIDKINTLSDKKQNKINIQDNTNSFQARTNIKFTSNNVTVTDDSVNDITLIDIAGGNGGFLNVKNLGMTIDDGGSNATISFTNPLSNSIDKIYLYVSYLEDLSNQPFDYVSANATLLSNAFTTTSGATNSYDLTITTSNLRKNAYIKVFVGYGGIDYSSGSSINQRLADVTPTSPVTNISITQITKDSVKLTWTNPTNSDLKSVNIIQKYDFAPTDIYDGTIVYTGKDTTCTLTGLDIGKHLYFKFYTLDTSDNIQSDTSQIIDIQIQNNYTSNVQSFTSVAGNGSISLQITDTDDINWKGCMIRRSTVKYPLTITDGDLVTDYQTKNLYKTTGYNNSGLNNSTQYFYTIFPYNKLGIYNENGNSVNQSQNTPVAGALYDVVSFTTSNANQGLNIVLNWKNNLAPYGSNYISTKIYASKIKDISSFTMADCSADSSVFLIVDQNDGINSNGTFTHVNTNSTLGFTLGDTLSYKAFMNYDLGASNGISRSIVAKDTDAPVNVTSLNLVSGDGTLSIYYTDPSDTDFNKSVIIVTKGGYQNYDYIGSDLIYTEETTKDKYKTTPLTLTSANGIQNNVTYYVWIYPKDTTGNINTNIANRNSATPQPLPIYGVQFDSSTKTWTRLGLASTMSSTDFNSLSPYKDIKRVLLTDAKAKTYLKSTDSTLKEDNTSATLDGTLGNVFSEFPKLYYKYENSGTIHKWYIANSAIGGCTTHKAFIRNSVTKDYLYIGCYKGYVNGTKLESRSGIMPTVTGKSYADFRTLAEARGTGFTQFDSLSLHLLQVLFLIQYGNADFSNVLNSGQDIGTILTTGGSNSLGNSTGIVGNYSSLYGVENLVGGSHSIVDGLIAGSKYWQSNNNFGSMTSESSSGTYAQLSTSTPSNTNGFISDIEPLDSVIIGKTMTGSSSDGFNDYQVSKNGSNLNVMLLGGSSLASQRGLFNNEFVDVTNMSTTTNMTSEGTIDSTYAVWSYQLDRSNFGIKSLSTYSLVDGTNPAISANLQISNLSGRLIAY